VRQRVIVALMKDGTASHTARSVAAHRLEYARVPAGHGDPAADQLLTADVAAGQRPARTRMHEYLRERTAFFDQVVVDSIDSGLRQVVIGGAGYDGRALRYARPGVRWFEIDHPATQADKRERLARLGIDTRHVRFIAADFTGDPIAEPLIAAGLDAGQSALFLLEGVAVYLDPPVVERVLAEFRAATAVGGLLAVSVSVASSTSQTRARFRERVAAHGEPARSEFSYDETRDLLAASGWTLRDASGRQRSLGLLAADAATDAAADTAASAGVPGA
jgi:methyltransferase (TIGR00027 family)